MVDVTVYFESDGQVYVYEETRRVTEEKAQDIEDAYEELRSNGYFVKIEEV